MLLNCYYRNDNIFLQQVKPVICFASIPVSRTMLFKRIDQKPSNFGIRFKEWMVLWYNLTLCGKVNCRIQFSNSAWHLQKTELAALLSYLLNEIFCLLMVWEIGLIILSKVMIYHSIINVFCLLIERSPVHPWHKMMRSKQTALWITALLILLISSGNVLSAVIIASCSIEFCHQRPDCYPSVPMFPVWSSCVCWL